MLLGDFYTIQSIQEEDASINAILELNRQHPIFAGHFPSQPVVPGACLLQIVKEIMQTVTGNDLQLKKANQIKFLSIINPVNSSLLRVTIKHAADANDEITVSANFSDDTTIYCKFSGLFQTCK